MWDRRRLLFDWVIFGASSVMALVTLWAASYPVADSVSAIALAFGWSFVAIGWSLQLLVGTTDRLAVVAGMALLVGAVTTIPPVAIFWFLVVVVGAPMFVFFAMVGAVLFATVLLRSRVKRAAWIAAPAIVIITLGGLVTGAPRIARMTFAEPALTSFAQSLEHGHPPLPVYFEQPLEVGSITIYEAYEWGGGIHLVTAFIGVLGDDGAGIAYLPDGPTRGMTYEHLVGPWYRWSPYATGFD